MNAFLFKFIWLRQVLVVARGRCVMQDLLLRHGGAWGLFVATRGLLPSCGAQAPESVGLVAPQHVGS